MHDCNPKESIEWVLHTDSHLSKSQCNLCGGTIGEGCKRWIPNNGLAEVHDGRCFSLMQEEIRKNFFC